MKILLIGPVYPYRGGIAHYTANLDRALRQAGHQVMVISFRRQYPAWLYPGKTDRDPSQKPLTVEAHYILDPFYPWTWQAAVHQAVQFQPNMVINQWWTTFWALPFAWLSVKLKQNKITYIYIIHNVLPHEKRLMDRWLAKTALKNADGFIAQTEQEKQRLLDLLPDSWVIVHHHPLYAMFDHPPITRGQARRTLGISEASKVILFFGIVRPYKGLRTLLEALALLRAAGHNLLLLVAGEFWEDINEYNALARELNIFNQLRFENRYIPNEEVGLFFSAADIMVAPYTGGTQSGSAGMALSFGLPLVASQIVASGLSGSGGDKVYVFPAGNVTMLAEAIQAALCGTPTPPSSNPLQPGWQQLVTVIENMVHQDSI